MASWSFASMGKSLFRNVFHPKLLTHYFFRAKRKIIKILVIYFNFTRFLSNSAFSWIFKLIIIISTWVWFCNNRPNARWHPEFLNPRSEWPKEYVHHLPTIFQEAYQADVENIQIKFDRIDKIYNPSADSKSRISIAKVKRRLIQCELQVTGWFQTEK